MDERSDEKNSVESESSDEDVVLHDADEVFTDEEGEEKGEQAIARLRKRLKSCQKERQEYLDGWQRARADLLNARKQFEEEKKNFIAFAEQGLLVELIKVLDSFAMAFANKEAWGKIDPAWRKGVEYIHQQLLATLQSRGLTMFNPEGEVFNPELHESVAVVESDKAEDDNKIVSVLQPGFKLGGRVLRPAKVTVAQHRSA